MTISKLLVNNRKLVLFLASLTLVALIASSKFNDLSFIAEVPKTLTTFLKKPTFSDVAKKVGIIDYPHLTGAAWVDYDNDGYLDFFIAGGGNHLYKNNGDETFADVTESAGLALRREKNVAYAGAFGDYDNDGCIDLYLSVHAIGEAPSNDVLYRNNCNGTFTDVSKKAALKLDNYSGRGIAWSDYDNDGFLDLYIANYGYFCLSRLFRKSSVTIIAPKIIRSCISYI